MALKALMIRKNLTDRQTEMAALIAHDDELVTREAEIEASIGEVATEEERAAVEQTIDEFEAEKIAHEEKKESLRAEIERLEQELAAIEEEQEAPAPEERKEEKPMEIRDNEIALQERAAFAEYVRTGQTRGDDYNMTKGNNGAIVPVTIARQIITKVQDIAPLYAMATKFNVKGQLDVPYYPASADHVISAAYGTEFVDLEASSGDFSSVSLTGFLAGALAKISKSLVNNTDVDVVDFVVDEMARAFASFIEKEAIVGTYQKIAGLAGGVTQYVTGTYKSSVTSDDLIDLQGTVKDAFQANACWLMAPATRNAIRKLKDAENRYLLIPDYRQGGTGFTLLGKPVYVSDNMPALGTTGNKAIYYGDFSGLGMKFSENLDIEILREHFARQHAIGVVGWTEVDAKVIDAQKLAYLACGSSDPT